MLLQMLEDSMSTIENEKEDMHRKHVVQHARSMSMFAACPEREVGIRFSQWCGTSPFICGKIWQAILRQGPLPRGCSSLHLLWCLVFMKTYTEESVLCVLFNADKKLFESGYGFLWRQSLAWQMRL
jgi:hypothetical protein